MSQVYECINCGLIGLKEDGTNGNPAFWGNRDVGYTCDYCGYVHYPREGEMMEKADKQAEIDALDEWECMHGTLSKYHRKKWLNGFRSAMRGESLDVKLDGTIGERGYIYAMIVRD